MITAQGSRVLESPAARSRYGVAVIDQALQNAVAINRIMKDGQPSFTSLENEKARAVGSSGPVPTSP